MGQWAACVALAALVAACEAAGNADSATVLPPDSTSPAADPAQAPYKARVDEGLGASVAILIDNSGSMWQRAPGDTREKYRVAKEAVQQMLLATEEIIRERPDFPVNVGIYRFSTEVVEVLPMGPYDRQKVRAALATMPRPGGSTAIGDGMDHAREALYGAGTFRKYILVLTDGENTHGRAPDEVAREIARRGQGAVQTYFVAFDTDPATFGFLKETGGDVFAARGGGELRTALSEVYRGKILAEAADYGEGAPPAAGNSATTPEARQR
ncbi:MAG TPA: vWA domain-containing protein [Longimicrobium sp.]|nr:vWA domain-containing protein [Longimicrobium sp.]